MDLYHYIAKKSIIQADNVLNAIFETTESLARNPEKFPLDRFKTKNDNSYLVSIYKRQNTYFKGATRKTKPSFLLTN